MERKSVMFIHGMFMNPECWREWMRRFEKRGYSCTAPAWPYHEGTVRELRAHPNAEIGKLTINGIVDYYRKILQPMKEKPVLVGHSLGGLIVQILLSEGLGGLGIAIDSAAPSGVMSYKFSYLKSNLPSVNPLGGNAPYLMPFGNFQYAFANTLPLAVQREAYDKFAVPESRNVPRTVASQGKVDFSRKRPPLLLIAGSADHIIPASLNKSNYERYKNSGSVTDFKEFEGRVHLILCQAGWEDVADYTIEWIGRNYSLRLLP